MAHLQAHGDSIVAFMQKKSISLQESDIKLELEMRTIISISVNLMTNGSITQQQLEQICDTSQPQRESVNMLFVVVLNDLTIVSAFMRILNSNSDLSYIAERINRTQLQLSAEEMNEFPDAKWKIVQMVKNTEYLKGEMAEADIKYIANRLYSGSHLDQDELEHIRYCTNNQPRRKAIDRLLKTVMLGNPLITLAFMHILQTNSHLSFIAAKINSTNVSPEEMQNFLVLEEVSQGRRQRVELRINQRFHISERRIQILIYYILHKGEIVDKISDRLLSKFFISIRDYTRILSLVGEDKIYQLFELMKNCPYEVYYELRDVLTNNDPEHVFWR